MRAGRMEWFVDLPGEGDANVLDAARHLEQVHVTFDDYTCAGAFAPAYNGDEISQAIWRS